MLQPQFKLLAAFLLLAPALANTNINPKPFFEPNTGQFPAHVDYTTRWQARTTYLSPGKIEILHPGEPTITIEFADSNKESLAEPLEPTGGKTNYFLGNDPEAWRTGIQHYHRIRYKNIYEGIDAEFYLHDDGVEYDFHVAPHADPSQIQIQITGAESRIDETTGDLIIGGSPNEFTQKRPVTYQTVSDRTRHIPARYERDDSGSYYLRLGRYDERKQLTIDPHVVFAAAYQHPNQLPPAVVAMGLAGNIVAGGITSDLDLTTVNSVQAEFRGDQDAFVLETRLDGTIVMLTYLGGSGIETLDGLAVCESGDVILAGYTESIEFPLVAPVVSTLGGGREAFVARIDAARGQLGFSTYLGGSGFDGARAVATDSSCAAYVTGITNSADFPLSNAAQPTPGGDEDIFVSKIPADGGSLEYSTFWGGSEADRGLAIAVDSTNAAVVAGLAGASDFPTLSPLSTSFNSGFVLKLAPTGAVTVATRWHGDSGIKSVAVDSDGNIAVGGFIESSGLIPVGAVQPSNGGKLDAFVTKWDSAISQVLFSTYLGGTGSETVAAVGFAGDDGLYLAGTSDSPDFPLTDSIVARPAVPPSSMLRSLDDGETWEIVGDGLPADEALVPSAVDPEESSHLWLHTMTDLYESLDGARTWRHVGPLPDSPTAYPRSSISVGSSDPQVLLFSGFNGLWRSIDGGESWVGVAVGPGFAGLGARVAFAPYSTNVAVAIDSSRIYTSTDAGATWTESLPEESIGVPVAIAWHPAETRVVTVLAWEGLYRSTDAGTTWTFVPTTGLPGLGNSLVRDLRYLSDGKLIFAGSGELFLSEDGGMTWRFLARTYTYRLPHAPEQGLAANSLFLAGAPALRSLDQGHTWHALTSPPTANRRVYAHPSAGLFVSGPERKQFPFITKFDPSGVTIAASTRLEDRTRLAAFAAGDGDRVAAVGLAFAETLLTTNVQLSPWAVAGWLAVIDFGTTTCSHQLSPPELVAPSRGGYSEPISFLAPSGCPWTSSSDATWLELFGPPTGSGSQSTAAQTSPNPGPSRSASARIGTAELDVHQAGADCTYAFSPSVAVVPRTGGSVEISLQTGPGCPWQIEVDPAGIFSDSTWRWPDATTGIGPSKLVFAAVGNPVDIAGGDALEIQLLRSPLTAPTAASAPKALIVRTGTCAADDSAPIQRYLDAGSEELEVQAPAPDGCLTELFNFGFERRLGFFPPTGNQRDWRVEIPANRLGREKQSQFLLQQRVVSVTQRATHQTFDDVLPPLFYFDAVNLLRSYNITDGCASAPLRYCPSSFITRGQMAVFAIRAIFGDDDFPFTETPYFTDVPASHPFFKWIQAMRDLGITDGCGAGVYCPNALVTRGQMAVFLIRIRLGSSADFTIPADALFDDVPTSHVFYRWIQKLRELAVTSGCATGRYCPGAFVTRGQMAVFLMRGAFNQLRPENMPLIESISPATLARGATATITIRGKNTYFAQGESQLAAIPGVTASNLTVVSPIEINVQLTANADAEPHPRSLTITGSGFDTTGPNLLNIE